MFVAFLVIFVEKVPYGGVKEIDYGHNDKVEEVEVEEQISSLNNKSLSMVTFDFQRWL